MQRVVVEVVAPASRFRLVGPPSSRDDCDDWGLGFIDRSAPGGRGPSRGSKSGGGDGGSSGGRCGGQRQTTPRDSGSGSGRSRGASRRRQAGDGRDPKTDAPARGAGDEPDVLLDVPKLTVEEISLEVDNLHAQIALEARLADLVPAASRRGCGDRTGGA
jgi:hypothetical protein